MMATIALQYDYLVPVIKTWNAITRPEEMKHWYFQVPDFELKTGVVFTFYEREPDGQFLHQCEILRVIPLERFEHTWQHPVQSKGISNLLWQLYALNKTTTRLALTHSGLENLADGGPAFAPENYTIGWKAILGSNLKNYLWGN